MLSCHKISIALFIGLCTQTLNAQIESPAKDPAASPTKAEKRAAKELEKPGKPKLDAKHTSIGDPSNTSTDDFTKFGIYENTARLPESVAAIATELPLPMQVGDRVLLIGNTFGQ